MADGWILNDKIVKEQKQQSTDKLDQDAEKHNDFIKSPEPQESKSKNPFSFSMIFMVIVMLMCAAFLVGGFIFFKDYISPINVTEQNMSQSTVNVLEHMSSFMPLIVLIVVIAFILGIFLKFLGVSDSDGASDGVSDSDGASDIDEEIDENEDEEENNEEDSANE